MCLPPWVARAFTEQARSRREPSDLGPREPSPRPRVDRPFTGTLILSTPIRIKETIHR